METQITQVWQIYADFENPQYKIRVNKLYLCSHYCHNFIQPFLMRSPMGKGRYFGNDENHNKLPINGKFVI